MAKPKILVVGSFVMDQIGTTTVFPKQGETVLGGKFSKAPGGRVPTRQFRCPVSVRMLPWSESLVMMPTAQIC